MKLENVMFCRGVIAVALAGVAVAGMAAAASGIARTADGHPDLSGTYDTATLTPLQRPAELGDRLFLSKEEAAEIAEKERAYIAARSQSSDPNRVAPPEGGDGSEGASGNVGGYNAFWIDRGSAAFELDGKVRTSIIFEPANGRQPPMTPAAIERFRARRGQFGRNDGTAWWLDRGAQGPYDDPEVRPLGERCLLGFGSTAGPPMMPVLYNNTKRIVQTPEYVAILVEMNHDARIIQIDSKHGSAEMRRWLGDSVGHWEGDTLVVETRHFRNTPSLSSASRDLSVVERFSRLEDGSLRYQFTVDDPTTWTETWSGEYPWRATDGRVYEYACHEGNYALGNILRGARLLEAETSAKSGAGELRD